MGCHISGFNHILHSVSLPSQALDGDFSEENRNRCRVATAPLIEAVENLTTFASNPEFASVPAQISNEVLYDRVNDVCKYAHITCIHLHSGLFVVVFLL